MRKSAWAMALAAITGALTGCGSPAREHPAATDAMASRAAKAKILSSTSKLPAGTWYVLAGPNDLSGNVWEANKRGSQSELTHNTIENFGIDFFDASRAGIVVSNAASEYDEIQLLTKNGGGISTPGGHGYVPIITSTGRLYYVQLHNYKTFQIATQEDIRAKVKVVYSQVRAVGELGLDSDDDLMFVANPHVGNDGAPSSIRVVLGARSNRKVATKVTAPKNVTVSPNSAGVAVTGYSNAGWVEIGTRSYRVPAGWLASSWSPSGKDLILYKGRDIGLWAPGPGQTVTVVAQVTAGNVIEQVQWLRTPARLAQ